MFEAGVLAFGVLPDDDDVHVMVARGQAWEVEAVDEGGVEIELLPELHVEGIDTAAHGGDQAALETHLVLPNRFQHLLRHHLHVPVDIELLKVHRRVHRLHHLLHGARHHGPNPVARDERHRPRFSVAGAVHVGDGSGGDPIGRGARDEVPEER